MTTPAGTSATNAGDHFTFVTPAPAVTSVSPTSGSTDGGTVVTITGTDFTGATAVDFGSDAATAYTVNSPTSITATTPAEVGGHRRHHGDHVCRHLGHLECRDHFTFVTPAPAVTSVSPTSGSTDGGTVVTITGTDLTGASVVDFGSDAATAYTVNSPTSITATTPAESRGHRRHHGDHVCRHLGHLSRDHFTFVAPSSPTVTGVSPTSGSTDGGTSVTITGTNFTGATAVDFGSDAATAYTVNSSTSITATTPAESAGTVDTTVTTGSGTSATSGADEFTFVTPAPAVTSVSPTSGSTDGGTVVTITGTDLTGATVVDFGSDAATAYTVNSPTSITATTPAEVGGHRRHHGDHLCRHLGHLECRPVHLRDPGPGRHLGEPDLGHDPRRDGRDHHRDRPHRGQRGRLRV